MGMKITREEVEKIALLARLKLTEAEVEQYRTQLSEVLTYIEQLKEATVKDVPTTAQVTGLTNVMADDAAAKSGDAKQLLAGAPATEGDSIKVKAVFDE